MSTHPAIQFHCEALLRVVMGLFEYVGVTPDGEALQRLPKTIQNVVLRALLPAESAARRLILFVSRRVTLVEQAGRGRGKKGKLRTGKRAPVFNLFDRQRYFPELADPSKKVGGAPGIRIYDFETGLWYPPRPRAKEPRDPSDATRIGRRMVALHRALSGIEREAKRLKRAMARREKAPPGPKRCGPVRPGWPPGYRERATLEVDRLLAELHAIVIHDRAFRRGETRPPSAPG